MFEGFNAGLWNDTSGRLLWMTQPAWPSTMWQILSHDYDTHAAFYGVQKASEPVHAQMNLPDFGLAVVNTTRTAMPGLALRARVYSLDNRLLLDTRAAVNAAADQTTGAGKLALRPLLAANPVVLVKLDLRDAAGRAVSENLYWHAAERTALQRLNALPVTPVAASATARRDGAEVRVRVHLANRGRTAALNTKLTLLGADGKRILPAYYSDNYVSLLPGDTREIDIAYAAAAAPTGAASVAVRGWNVSAAPARVAVP
jgi:hypothetical protein